MTIEEMRRVKQEKGYTMAQLSACSGVPLGTLQKIFNGETKHPRYKTRQAIEKVLGGTEAFFFLYNVSKYHEVSKWSKLREPLDGIRGDVSLAVLFQESQGGNGDLFRRPVFGKHVADLVKYVGRRV